MDPNNQQPNQNDQQPTVTPTSVPASPEQQAPTTPQPTTPMPPVQQRGKKGMITGVLIAVVAVFILLMVVGYFATKRDAKEIQDKVDELLTSEESKAFTSTEYGFSIEFPGFPTSQSESINVSGYDIPFTYYTQETDNGNKVYMVVAGTYPSELDYSTEASQTSALEGTVNGSAQSINGTIDSSEFTTFAGKKAIVAKISGVQEGEAFEYFTTNFLDGNTLYQIVTINTSQSEYDGFKNSFKFN